MDTYEIRCIFCKKVHKLKLDPEKVQRWKSGELVQHVFPELSPGDRELLISNICPTCFSKMFEEEE